MAFLSYSRALVSLLATLTALAVEGAFSWLCSQAYVTVLHPYEGRWELEVFQWLVFFALTSLGFVLTVHRRYGVAAIHVRAKTGARSGVVGVFVAAGIVVAHDWGGVMYTIWGTGREPTSLTVTGTVGLCALALLPFLIGYLLTKE